MIEKRGMQFWRSGDTVVVRAAPVGAHVAAHADLTSDEWREIVQVVGIGPTVTLKAKKASKKKSKAKKAK